MEARQNNIIIPDRTWPAQPSVVDESSCDQSATESTTDMEMKPNIKVSDKSAILNKHVKRTNAVCVRQCCARRSTRMRMAREVDSETSSPAHSLSVVAPRLLVSLRPAHWHPGRWLANCICKLLWDISTLEKLYKRSRYNEWTFVSLLG